MFSEMIKSWYHHHVLYMPMKINVQSSVTRNVAFIVEGGCLFGLGTGIAKYLGYSVNWEATLLAWFWVVCLQLAGIFFRLPMAQQTSSKQVVPNQNFILNRNNMIGLALLACISSITVLMLSQGYLYPSLIPPMLLGLISTLAVSLQPWRSNIAGYQEIVISFGMTVLLPWISFSAQSGNIHRFLPLISFPLFTLRLAMTICMELPTYARDLKTLTYNLLVRLGWQNGMMLHNLLILSAFLILALSLVIGLSPAIALPALSCFIIGLLQIYWMRRIAAGDKPNWQALITGSVSLYALVLYLLSYSFWVR